MRQINVEPASVIGQWRVTLSAGNATATSSPAVVHAGEMIEIKVAAQTTVHVGKRAMVVKSVESIDGLPISIVFEYDDVPGGPPILCHASACLIDTVKFLHGISTVGDPDTAAVWAAEQSG